MARYNTHTLSLGPERCPKNENNNSEANGEVFPWEKSSGTETQEQDGGLYFQGGMISNQLTESIPKAQANPRQLVLVKDTQGVTVT